LLTLFAHCADDTAWFRTQLEERLLSVFEVDWADVIPSERLLFGDFLEPNAERRVYRMVEDLGALEATVTEYLTDYNDQVKTPGCD
jgi:dynein heavy chain